MKNLYIKQQSKKRPTTRGSSRIMRCLALVAASILSMQCQAHNQPITIGVVAPIDIQAMHEITAGFEQTLQQQYPGKLQIIVKNAEGDPMLQQAIIKQFSKQHIDYIAPIGTATFEMTAAMLHKTPILAIAAELSPAQRKNLTNQQVTDVVDEVQVPIQLKFVRQVMPHLKHITILHSTSNKIADEVAAFKQSAAAANIGVQDLTMPQASDLYTISWHIDPKSQAIFILKDEMIVSGMPTIVAQAERMHIPVIASDDGSVQNGAAFALGVREKDIGVRSAQVMLQALGGKSMAQLPITTLKHYTVFVNTQHAKRQGINLNKLSTQASKYHYPLQYEVKHG